MDNKENLRRGIYDRVIEVLEENGHDVSTQTAVAKYFDVHQSSVSGWQAGRKGIDDDKIYALCEDLKVCPNYIFSGVEPKYPLTPEQLELYERYRDRDPDEIRRAFDLLEIVKQTSKS